MGLDEESGVSVWQIEGLERVDAKGLGEAESSGSNDE